MRISPLRRLFSLITITGFFTVLTLPIVDYVSGFGMTAGDTKNQILSVMPEWSWDPGFLQSAPAQFQAFVDDHIAYRYMRKRVDDVSVPFHHLPPNLKLNLASGTDRPAQRFTTNSLGLRGPELTPESKYRILCIGGSTTQNYQLDDDDAWPQVLMTDLNHQLGNKVVWVGAAGIPGFTMTQHLEYVRTSPMMTQYTDVIFLVGVNDLLLWLEYTNPRSAASIQSNMRNNIQVRMQGEAFDLLVNNVEDWYRFLEAARSRRAESRIVAEHPNPMRMVQRYRSRIENTIDRCNELGIRPVFVTHPVLWAKGLSPSAEGRLWTGRMRAEGEYLDVSSLRELMDRLNEAMMATCKAREVLVVDLSFMNGISDYFEDDCHFTVEGSAVLAHRVADAWLENIRRN